MTYLSSMSIREVISDIKKKNNLDPTQYNILHSPSIEGGRGAIWMDNFGQSLGDYGIKDGDYIELKLKPQIVNICLNDATNNWLEDFNFSSSSKCVISSILVDFLDDINEYITLITQILPRAKQEEFLFQLITDHNGTIQLKWLNTNLSFSEQDVKPNGFICLYPLSALALQKRVGLPELEKTVKEGFLTKISIKPHKRTQPQKRWCVLRGNFLYYYSSQNQTTPNGVVALEYYDIQREKGRFEIVLKPFSNSFTKTLSTYIFECDEADFSDWFNHLFSKSAVGSGNAVFGVPLTKVMQRKSQSGRIPDIVTKSVQYLETNGLSVEGIFRVSGGAMAVTKFRQDFDRGLAPDLKACQDPNVVAGLLKLYVRELPEPLIPFEIYDEFLKIDAISLQVNEVIPRIKDLVQKLPQENLRVLTFLLVFLKKVVNNSEVNLMNAQNVSLVFGPNILRPKEGSPQAASLVQVTPLICKLIEILIMNQSEILPVIVESKPFNLMMLNNNSSNSNMVNTSPIKLMHNRPTPPQRKSAGPVYLNHNNNNRNNNNNNNENQNEASQQKKANWSATDHQGQNRSKGALLGQRNSAQKLTEPAPHINSLEEAAELLLNEMKLCKSLEKRLSELEKELEEEKEERIKLSELVQQLFN